jgi:methionyl-tRNA formyltransferase
LAAAGEDIALVVTQPERPRGRGRKTEPTPVGRAALELGLPVETPEEANTPDFVTRLRGLHSEFLVLVDYGQFLGAALLGVSRRGPVNVHPSLLPRHRGPSPVVWAILSGDTETGVSTMLMDEGMDTGPLLLQRSVAIGPEETAGELSARLSSLGAELLARTLEGIRSGAVAPIPQEDAAATYSRLIDRELQTVHWETQAREAIRRINALSPKPGARAWLGGKMLKILRAAPALGNASGAPGEVLGVREDGFDVACGVGALTVREVHPEGRNPMRAADFSRGGGVARGMRFDPTSDHS